MVCGQLDLRVGERVVGHRVGRVFGRWPAGSDATQLANGTSLSATGRLTSKTLCAAFAAAKTARRAARALDERVAVAGRHRRRGAVSSEENGPKVSVDLVGRDQLRVVGDDLVGSLASFRISSSTLRPSSPPLAFTSCGPQLVAALEGLAVGGEVARQRQRGADHDRLLGGSGPVGGARRSRCFEQAASMAAKNGR